jgi:hypothetical protein
MNKQFATIASILISLTLGLVIYFLFFEIGDKRIKPIQVVPENAALVVESNQSSQLLKNLKNLDFYKVLLNNNSFETYFNQVELIDSLTKLDKNTYSWLGDGECVYSMHVNLNKQPAFFMAMQIKQTPKIAELNRFVSTIYPGRFQVISRKFQGEELYDFQDFKSGYSFSVAFKSRLLILSFDGSLVEQAIVKFKHINPEKQLSENEAYLAKANKDFNCYIQYSFLAKFLTGTLDPSYNSNFTILDQLADKSFYQIQPDQNELVLKGAAYTNSKKFQFLDLFNGHAPAESKINAYLTESMIFNLNFNYNSYQKWLPNLNEYLKFKQLDNKYKSFADSINNHCFKTLQFDFTHVLGNQAGLFACLVPGIGNDSALVSYFEVNDTLGFENLMNKINDLNPKIIPDSLTNRTIVSDIKPYPLGDYLKVLYGDLFENITATHYIRNGHFVFISKSQETLSHLKLSWANQLKWINQERVINFKQKLIPQSNLELIIDASKASKFAMDYMNENWYGYLARNMGTFKKIGLIGIQFGGSIDKTFPSQIFVAFDSKQNEKSEKIWEIKLDTLAIGQAQSVFSSKTGEQVLIVQDVNNQVYQIDITGKINWKYQADGPIISQIHELDLFKNNQNQIAFNTEKYIYVLNEDGKSIQGWPIWIPTSTHYGMLAQSISSENDMAFFVTGRYYKLSAFNAQAKLLPGWNPLSIYPNLMSELYSIYSKGEVLLMGLNEKGGISSFNLKGEQVNQQFVDSAQVFNKIQILKIDSSQFLFIGSDSNQIVVQAFKNDRLVFKNKVQFEGPAEQLALNKQNNTIHAVSRKNTIVLDFNGKVLFKINTTDTNNTHYVFKPFGIESQVISYHIAKKIIESNNEMFPFPVSSNGVFVTGDLFKTQDQFLLNADANNNLQLFKIK